MLSQSEASAAATPDPLRILLARMAVSEHDALDELYDATSKRVFGLALTVLRDHALAEEATLDVYHYLWRNAGAYQPERATPIRWILTIARTRSIDVLRRRKRMRTNEERLPESDAAPDVAPTPPEQAEQTEDARRVRSALAQLPAPQREAITVTFFEGLSHSQAATRLAQPLGTVKTRIRNGLATLRSLLEKGAAS